MLPDLATRGGTRRLLAGLRFIVLAGLLAIPAYGARLSAQASDSAAVILQNRPVFVFRAALGSYTPTERAAMTRDRLARLLQGPGKGDSVVVEPVLGGVVVSVGRVPVLTLGPADADSLAGERLDAMADSAAARLRDAMNAERIARSPAVLLRGGLWALLATLLFILSLRLVVWLRRRSLGWVQAHATHDVSSRKLGGFQLLNRDQVRRLLSYATTVLTWIAGLLLADLWLGFVLDQFPYTAPWGYALNRFLGSTLGGLALGAIGTLPDLFTVLVIVVFIRFLTRLIRAFFRAVQSGRVAVSWLHPDIVAPTERIVIGLLWVFGLVVCYPYLPGSGSEAFKGASVFVGLIVTLGSGGSVNQIVSGLILVYARALRPGDYVRIGDIEGTVTEVGFVATRLRTPWQEAVTIPNAVVLGTATTNYSKRDRAGVLWYHTSVTIGYDAPWRQVHAMLLEAAERTGGIRRDPPPFVLQRSLSDFYVEYQLNFRPAEAEQRVLVLSELHSRIQDSFNEHGVQILSPHLMTQPERPVVVPPEQWWKPPATREGGKEGQPGD